MPLSEKQMGIASIILALLHSPEVPILTTEELTDILAHIKKNTITMESIPF